MFRKKDIDMCVWEGGEKKENRGNKVWYMHGFQKKKKIAGCAVGKKWNYCGGVGNTLI